MKPCCHQVTQQAWYPIRINKFVSQGRKTKKVSYFYFPTTSNPFVHIWNKNFRWNKIYIKFLIPQMTCSYYMLLFFLVLSAYRACVAVCVFVESTCQCVFISVCVCVWFDFPICCFATWWVRCRNVRWIRRHQCAEAVNFTGTLIIKSDQNTFFLHYNLLKIRFNIAACWTGMCVMG